MPSSNLRFFAIIDWIKSLSGVDASDVYDTFTADWEIINGQPTDIPPEKAIVANDLVKNELNSETVNLKAEGLKLNMMRGKPETKQVALSIPMLSLITQRDDMVRNGVDAANYGELAGMPEARRFFADILGCREEQVFVGGNASLTLMYDTVAKAFTHGLLHSSSPWAKQEGLKFLCPVPGYDRHFRITESFGFELISVKKKKKGPDMDIVEELIKDPKVKGMWNVPKYSNPAGIIYSEETVRRIASMKPAAEDFLLMWDNAYCVHEFDGDYVEMPDILSLCEKYGNADMVFEFASTSKVTFPGAGISCFACSEANMAYMKKLLGVQMISADKMNQLRHVLFLKDKENTIAHMKKHAVIMKPKFDMVCDMLDREIAPEGIATWTRPKGGYFVCVRTKPGLAKRTVELCKEAGVAVTPAGATHPYGIDPDDSVIRIAPSFPPIDELEKAMEVFCVCLKLAAAEKNV